MADSALIESLRDEVLHGARPPADPPTTKEFARTLRLPAGSKKGKLFDPDTDPNQRYLLEQIDSGQWMRFAVCGPPQVGGKTQTMILPPILREVIKLKDPVGYGLPTLDALDKAWLEKLKPSIEKSGYGRYLPLKGPGSKGGRGKVVQFRDPITSEDLGSLVFMTGGAFGNTAKIVVVDDIDQFRKGELPDRDAVEDIFHRTDSYQNQGQALCIAVGTIEWDDGSLILALIDDSTDTRPWPACPFCHVHQRLTWDHVAADYDTDASAMASARYRCEGCAVLWTEDDRQAALENVLFVHRGQKIEGGKVVGPAPQSRTLGLTWSALDSTLANLGVLAVDYRAARLAVERGDHTPMRKFARYRECRTYKADTEEMEYAGELKPEGLLDKSIACKFGPARHVTDKTSEVPGYFYSRHLSDPPSDVVGCIAGIDVQNDRVYWVLTAFALDGTTYDVAWGYEYARRDHQPWSRGELHELLDRTHFVVTAACDDVAFVGGALDVGDFSDDLIPWLQGHPGVWFPVKGFAKQLKEGPFDIPGIVHFNDQGLLCVRTDNLRDAILAAYRRPNGSVGTAHLPSGLAKNSSDMAYLRHLCAEQITIDKKTKKRVLKNGPGRHDWQDARKYAEAIIRIYLRDLRQAQEQPNPPPAAPPRKPSPVLTTPDGRPYLLSQR